MATLARGGMGEVFLGILPGAEGISTPVVVKRIRPEFAGETTFRTMFRDEAKALVHVRHPNVVHVIEFGAERNELFLAMEHIEGESASTLLRTLRKADESLPLSMAVYIVAQAAAGLHAAHEQKDPEGKHLQLIHRDVSPQNILVTYGGMAKLVDFGIAKSTEQDTLTRTGELKGKYGYMAPEQFQDRTLDRRVDVWALGTVLYELCASSRLFKRSSAHAAMRAICDEPIPPLRVRGADTPAWLQKVIDRSLAREPGERYASAREMRRDLTLGLRELDPEGRVEDELPALMLRLFGDRKRQKQELIGAVQEGVVTNVHAAADYAPNPTPSGASLSRVDQALANEAPKRKPLVALALLFAAVVGAGGVALSVAQGPNSESRAEAPAPSPASPEDRSPPAEPAPVVEVPTPPETVQVRVQSEPEGAEVFIEDELQGATPLSLQLPRDAATTLSLKLAGYRDFQETIDVAERDLELRYQLRRARRIRRQTMRPAPVKMRGFGRFD
ncbi:MAG: protein kinase [Myxococcota bacterium]